MHVDTVVNTEGKRSEIFLTEALFCWVYLSDSNRIDYTVGVYYEDYCMLNKVKSVRVGLILLSQRT